MYQAVSVTLATSYVLVFIFFTVLLFRPFTFYRYLLCQRVERAVCTAVVVVVPTDGLHHFLHVALRTARNAEEVITRQEVDAEVLLVLSVALLQLAHEILVVPVLQRLKLRVEVCLAQVYSGATL